LDLVREAELDGAADGILGTEEVTRCNVADDRDLARAAVGEGEVAASEQRDAEASEESGAEAVELGLTRISEQGLLAGDRDSRCSFTAAEGSHFGERRHADAGQELDALDQLAAEVANLIGGIALVDVLHHEEQHVFGLGADADALDVAKRANE